MQALFEWGQRLVDAAALDPAPFDDSAEQRAAAQVEGVETRLAALHGSKTVSAVAFDWGFWHFGEFSRAYKECFGELPSDTLRRAPGCNR